MNGIFTGIPFGFEGLDQRLGWSVGGGVDGAFSGHWSVTLEYDYYQFGHRSVLMSDPINLVSGPADFKQSVSRSPRSDSTSICGTVNRSA